MARKKVITVMITPKGRPASLAQAIFCKDMYVVTTPSEWETSGAHFSLWDNAMLFAVRKAQLAQWRAMHAQVERAASIYADMALMLECVPSLDQINRLEASLTEELAA